MTRCRCLGVIGSDLDIDLVDLAFLTIGEEDTGDTGDGGVLRSDADPVIAADGAQIECLKGEEIASVGELLQWLAE